MKSPSPSQAHKNDHHGFINLQRFGYFLLCLLALTSILSFIILYVPNPFTTFIPKQFPFQNQSSPNLKNALVYDYEQCDLFSGQWIPDLNGSSSIYTNYSCPTIPDSKNCLRYGRSDLDYLNWRWKPHGCELSRFDPKVFLKIVQGKTLAFIGDSVARNQMESLLCLLYQEDTPKDIYKDSEDRYRTWYFPVHNFTLKAMWTRFLVYEEEIEKNGTKTGSFNLYLDKVDKEWVEKLSGIDYAILSDGHWFFRPLYLHEDNILLGCVYCDDPNITKLPPKFALQRVFRTALRYINGCKEDCNGLFTIVRTFSPAHFEKGAWNTGGRCNRTSPFSEKEINLESGEMQIRNVQREEIERAMKKARVESGRRLEFFDVTKAMLMRPDGHPDIHWNNIWVKGASDCVHWCLPGAVDTWNQLLLAVLVKTEGYPLEN